MELTLELPPFLTRRDDGEIVIAGTRITLYHFLWQYNAGESAESLATDHSSLKLTLVHKLIAFYLENKTELDGYSADYDAELNRLRAAGSPLNLDMLRARSVKKAAVGQPEDFADRVL